MQMVGGRLFAAAEVVGVAWQDTSDYGNIRERRGSITVNHDYKYFNLAYE